MNPRTGVIFRLLGPSIEIACAILLQKFGGRDIRWLGQPIETFLYVGFAAGLILVACGLILARPAKRIARRLDDEGVR